MKNTAIIIPSRLAAERFPNKPLEKINNLPMIVHVINRAKESQVGEVFVATPDDKIFNIVNILNDKLISHISSNTKLSNIHCFTFTLLDDIISNSNFFLIN